MEEPNKPSLSRVALGAGILSLVMGLMSGKMLHWSSAQLYIAFISSPVWMSLLAGLAGPRWHLSRFSAAKAVLLGGAGGVVLGLAMTMGPLWIIWMVFYMIGLGIEGMEYIGGPVG